MKKSAVKKLCLAKDTVSSLDTRDLEKAVQGAGVSDNWQNTTCLAPA